MAFPLKPNPSEVKSVLLGRSKFSTVAVNKVFRAALDQMLLLYYPPYRAADDSELLAMVITGIEPYVEDLAVFDEDRLAAAWRHVRRRHKTQGWPVLGVIMDACGFGEDNQTVGFLSGVDSREKRKQLIEDLLTSVLWNGELGRQAAQEGWADSLRIFIRENAAVPGPDRIAKMQGGEAQASACMADLERQHAAGDEVSGIDKLRGIRQAMLIRNATIGEQILKGNRPMSHDER
jgi:hypothetical protein